MRTTAHPLVLAVAMGYLPSHVLSALEDDDYGDAPIPCPEGPPVTTREYLSMATPAQRRADYLSAED